MSEIIQTDLFGNVIINKFEDVHESKSKPKDISDTIETEYIIEVVCKNERDQENIYNELTKSGKICRVLTL